MESESNVLGGELRPCSTDPMTGFMRDGYCYPLQRDPGRHEICAVMTDEFLEFGRQRGSDLVTPRPDLNFPGLTPGDRWCVCVPRWIEAYDSDAAPPVILDGTSADVLYDVSLETLRECEFDGNRMSDHE